jgi:hypothetical protein
MIIKIDRLKGTRSFIGKENGKKIRKKYNLNSMELTNEKITIIFPKETISITSSFTKGMFGESFENMNLVQFENKYTFECNEFVLRGLNIDIQRLGKE